MMIKEPYNSWCNMTITDDYIDTLIAEHYPAHTSPMAEIHHRECIRAIVEAVAGMRWRPVSELPELKPREWVENGQENAKPLLVWMDKGSGAALGDCSVNALGHVVWYGNGYGNVTHWCEIEAPEEDV